MKKHILYVVLLAVICILIVSCSPGVDQGVRESIDEITNFITDTVSELVNESETTQVIPLVTEGFETKAPEQNATHKSTETSPGATPTLAAVTELQKNLLLEQRLQALGYFETGIIDGIIDQQTALAIARLHWLNKMPITGESTPALLEMLRGSDLVSPTAQPPYPARALSRNLPGGFEVGFLTGRLVDLGYLVDDNPGFVPYGINAYAEPAVKQF